MHAARRLRSSSSNSTKAAVSGPVAEPSGAPGLPAPASSNFLWKAGAVLLTAVICVVVGYRLRIAQRKQA